MSLVNQIRRVLFQEDDEESPENLAPQGGNLANLLAVDTTKSKTRRRGKRQKWISRRESTRTTVAASKKRGSGAASVLMADMDDNTSVLTQTSRARSTKGISVLADIGNTSVLSQSSSRTSHSASPASMSVLAGFDNESVASQTSSRDKTADGGLMSLFAMPVTNKTKQGSRKKSDKPVLGGLLGAVGIEDASSQQSRKQDTRAKHGKRGRRRGSVCLGPMNRL